MRDAVRCATTIPKKERPHMSGFRIIAILAAMVLAPAALAQTADDPGAERPTADVVGGTSYVTAQPSGSMFSSDLVGRPVLGRNAEKIGDINDLLVLGDGQLAAVVIGVGGFLGVGEKDVALPLEELDLTLRDGEIELSIDTTEAELEAAPTFVRADGTTSDRLGAFQRSFERTRADAEALIDTAGERAGELVDEAAEATRRAQEDADEYLERGRRALRILRGEEEEPAAEPAPDAQ
jgi:hypothetical protein